MHIEVKICGLGAADAVDAALEAGADMVGFVFFPPSPRNLGLDAAARLAQRARGRAAIVALTVDADDATLDAIAAAVRPDMLQLHGRETPERIRVVRARLGIPVMKALGVASSEDLAAAAIYENAADRLLLDAKPPKGASRPGGNGAAFDWGLLDGFAPPFPWMLSGGITPETVAAALRATGARAVDVSSGVESAPGIKDPERIRAFVEAVRRASPGVRAA